VMRLAVLYCRSSKDRADVSIEVQRRELNELAIARGLTVVGEFADSVESGKDEDRPGLQRLLEELRRRDRAWTVVLALDTSRIARRAAAAYWFEDRECRPRGVSVVYKNLPEMEDAERAIVKAVFHGVDEWHSLVSKRKGLAGMRQNVQNGFRAGGRAPYGYRLEHVDTGAVREGRAVQKSRLVAGDEAPRVAAFLRDRAIGVPRMRSARAHGLACPPTTLLGIERNALTYAGHTVWNVHREQDAIGPRHRPRADWVVKRDTHPALITEAEAEAVLDQLAQRRAKATHAGKHEYLLSGLLRTPDGRTWHGADGSFYRHGRGRRVLARRVDRAVVDAVTADLAGDELARTLLEHMRARMLAAPSATRAAAARRKVETLERQIHRLAELAVDSEAAAPLLRTLAAKERERDALQAELAAAQREAATAKAWQDLGVDDVRQALRTMAADAATGRDDGGAVRAQLAQLVARVELDPEDAGEVVIRYRVPALGGAAGVSVASPQGFEQYPGSLPGRRVQLAA